MQIQEKRPGGVIVRSRKKRSVRENYSDKQHWTTKFALTRANALKVSFVISWRYKFDPGLKPIFSFDNNKGRH